MGDVRWLSPDEQVAWRAYIRGVAVVLETLNQDMETVNGISLHEYEVLSYLSESADWTLRMSTLADLLVHSRSRLTHTVRRLESQGYVRRIPCEDDRRGLRQARGSRSVPRRGRAPLPHRQARKRQHARARAAVLARVRRVRARPAHGGPLKIRVRRAEGGT